MCVDSVIVITIHIESESETPFAFRRGGCCSEPSDYAMLTLIFLYNVPVVKTVCHGALPNTHV